MMTSTITEKCVACAEPLGRVRTTVRRPDGAVRFVMCHECFEQRFCHTCLTYFASRGECQEHQCPN